jgi:hypothetical protein
MTCPLAQGSRTDTAPLAHSLAIAQAHPAFERQFAFDGAALLLKLLELLGLCHEVGGKRFKFVRGCRMRACPRKASTCEGALAKIFYDFGNHGCVIASTPVSDHAGVLIAFRATFRAGNGALLIRSAKEKLAIFGQSLAGFVREEEASRPSLRLKRSYYRAR